MITVVIIIGSDSDIKKMLPAKEILDKMGVDCAMRISSAHRTSKNTREIVYDAEKNGCKIFICGAGMAAHLAGTVAALTIKPVIGVPLTSAASPLSGVDALYSTVQMPSGIPVAVVAIDGAKNAAWLAVQMLAMNDGGLNLKILETRDAEKNKIFEADKKLQEELANAGKEKES